MRFQYQPSQIYFQYQDVIPHIDTGCTGPNRKVVNSFYQTLPGINTGFTADSQVFGGSNVDLNGDGESDVHFSDIRKLSRGFRWGGDTNYYGFPFTLYEEACQLGPVRDVGFVGFADPNFDGTPDSFHLCDDPLETTYEAEVGNITPVILPHFGNGGDPVSIISHISIDNPSKADSVSGEIFFFDDSGNNLQTGFTGFGTTDRIPFSIEPGGKLDIVSDGTGSVVTGSVWIFADGPVGAIERFKLSDGLGTAGVGAHAPSLGVIIPVTRRGSFSTGVAYTNATEKSITVKTTLQNSDGTPFASAPPQSVEPRAHVSKFIQEFDFDTPVPPNFEGTLILEAVGGGIVGEALELDQSGNGDFGSLPLTTLGE